MQYGRLTTFLLAILVGGLLQLWVFVMVLSARGHEILVHEVLGDGGLFFFATSLAVGSAISLFDHHPLKVGKTDFNITLAALIFIMVPVLVYYSTIQGEHVGLLSKLSSGMRKYATVVGGGGISAALADQEISRMLSNDEFARFLSEPKPFSNHLILQLVYTAGALAYWFFCGLRTGLFVEKENDPD